MVFDNIEESENIFKIMKVIFQAVSFSLSGQNSIKNTGFQGGKLTNTQEEYVSSSNLNKLNRKTKKNLGCKRPRLKKSESKIDSLKR